MSKHAYSGLSILELSKMLMYGIWYDYVKRQYNGKAKLCYMDTDSFIVYIKTDAIYKDIEEDVETRFDTSSIRNVNNWRLWIWENIYYLILLLLLLLLLLI